MANGNAGLFVDWSRSEGGRETVVISMFLTIEDTQKKSGNIFICDVIGVLFSLSVWQCCGSGKICYDSDPDSIFMLEVRIRSRIQIRYTTLPKSLSPTGSRSTTSGRR
jgi:hypothetical protein